MLYSKTMKKINNCSLICIDCYNYGNAVSALQKSMSQNQFDKILFFTDIEIDIEGIEVIKIDSIRSKEEYSHFCVKELWKHITTDYVLNIHHDGYTLNGELFDERLYDYDWCGSLWLESDGYANGNGGYSWKSRKLLNAIGQDEMIRATHPEDVQTCRTYRNYLEKVYGLQWATDEICEKFSYELREPNQPTMGFHGYFHKPYKPTIILKRSGALGDCIILEPILRYYYNHGYNVVLDIPLPFFDIYAQHYFSVKHISQFDAGRIKPVKEINLDMAYEVKPRQNYLKSYFEFCGISDYELTKPQLHPLVNERTKPFKKYAVIHIDNRETAHRNIYGVDWRKVENHLKILGYTVIQIGANEHEQCGIEYNTSYSIAVMKHIVAGCDLFVGIDSAPSNIAVAYNKPCVLFFGSVCPDYIHPDLTNVEVIQGDCETAYCWHKEGSKSGQPCAFAGTSKYLQCCVSSFEIVIDKINKLVK
jgi:hypothetical protein